MRVLTYDPTENKMPAETLERNGILIVIQVYTKDEIPAMLCKIITDGKNCEIMPRFVKDKKLQQKFNKRFKNQIDRLYHLLNKAYDIDEFISSSESYFDLDIIDNPGITDMFPQNDLTDRIELFDTIKVPISKSIGRPQDESDIDQLALELEKPFDEGGK